MILISGPWLLFIVSDDDRLLIHTLLKSLKIRIFRDVLYRFNKNKSGLRSTLRTGREKLIFPDPHFRIGFARFMPRAPYSGERNSFLCPEGHLLGFAADSFLRHRFISHLVE
jgi:hypothetical protein